MAPRELPIFRRRKTILAILFIFYPKLSLLDVPIEGGSLHTPRLQSPALHTPTSISRSSRSPSSEIEGETGTPPPETTIRHLLQDVSKASVSWEERLIQVRIVQHKPLAQEFATNPSCLYLWLRQTMSLRSVVQSSHAHATNYKLLNGTSEHVAHAHIHKVKGRNIGPPSCECWR
jgi:hypothetical protein